jgi:hypothetical protein
MTGAAFAPPARACGGFFCDVPPGPTLLPVAQTGENVLFSMDRTAAGQYHLEAHIQIFYAGPASKFSWVVPVDAMPELDLGSNAVFAALDGATRPQIMVNRKREGVCSDDAPGFSLGAGGSANDKGAPVPGSDDDAGGVQVTLRRNIGPYDATVVRADDAGRLKAWLAENGYFLSDEGSRLIDTYVTEQKFFVALKLLSGAGVSEIQPIVLRFDGRGPCVPLRLTAVAAIDDLRVNLWVLAENRVVPENYFEIAINEAKLDWLGGGGNYQALLTAAANEAGGNAFAVEYAGVSTPLRNRLVPPNGFDFARLRTLTPGQLMVELSKLGLDQDPEVMRVVQSPPRDLSVADALITLVLQPRVHAQQLFDTHAKVTRLVTFISPEEMKVDPTFLENSTLPDVSNLRVADAVLQCGARDFSSCDAPMRLALPGGKSVYYKAPADGWCANPGGTFAGQTRLTAMPALELGWQREAIGEGALRFDNRAAIASALAAQEADIRGCSCALGARSGDPAPAALLVLLGSVGLALRRRRS